MISKHISQEELKMWNDFFKLNFFYSIQRWRESSGKFSSRNVFFVVIRYHLRAWTGQVQRITFVVRRKHHRRTGDPLPVWPDWEIYWTFGKFLKPLATINLSKSLTFLGNFCKGVKIFQSSSEIILGNFYRHLAIFFCSHCGPSSYTHLESTNQLSQLKGPWWRSSGQRARLLLW